MTVEKLNFYRQSAKEVSSLDKKIDARMGKGSMSKYDGYCREGCGASSEGPNRVDL